MCAYITYLNFADAFISSQLNHSAPLTDTHSTASYRAVVRWFGHSVPTKKIIVTRMLWEFHFPCGSVTCLGGHSVPKSGNDRISKYESEPHFVLLLFCFVFTSMIGVFLVLNLRGCCNSEAAPFEGRLHHANVTKAVQI